MGKTLLQRFSLIFAHVPTLKQMAYYEKHASDMIFMVMAGMSMASYPFSMALERGNVRINTFMRSTSLQ